MAWLLGMSQLSWLGDAMPLQARHVSTAALPIVAESVDFIHLLCGNKLFGSSRSNFITTS